jgi:protein-tyrosine phosphatase
MRSLYDIHNHLLPDVDDGCRTLDETLRHLKSFRSQGVVGLAFSPHLLVPLLDDDEVDAILELHRARFEEVERAAGDDDAYPRLHGGQEILARTGDEIERVVHRTDVGIAGGDALLVELGFSPGFDGESVIRRVRAEGRRVVIAHPERYAWGDRDPVATADRWRELGAVLQVNGGSLAGLYTERAADLAVRFLENGLIDMVCSDHHGDFRVHDPSEVAEVVEAMAGPDAVDALMGAGPCDAILAAPVGEATRTG